MFNLKILLLILAGLCFSGAVARNTLKQGERFNSSVQLVSENGAVTLNFIKQEYDRTWDGKDFGFYLAINYTVSLNDPVVLSSWGHPIWLANREDPIADESGVLVIDETGLKITHDGAQRAVRVMKQRMGASDGKGQIVEAMAISTKKDPLEPHIKTR
ncbi:hypothetical protein CCACVL1_14563 [Corchorus capsularis]|uniref:Uncharacterized protein n=1 Tax=Corchorus capsularis TaxID=210143 RepID=A0A1R3I6P5_COCAP|nr:hypothetical protein CCACVL1_14563 [Corchorus capsularis]